MTALDDMLRRHVAAADEMSNAIADLASWVPGSRDLADVDVVRGACELLVRLQTEVGEPTWSEIREEMRDGTWLEAKE